MQNRRCLAGAIALFGLPALATGQPPPPPAPPIADQVSAPAACTSSDHRAFDFWVGEWNVFPNGGTSQVATSSIKAMYAGCAIRESWQPLNGGGGGSFSHFDRDRRQWRQMWIDSSGTRVDFSGGVSEGRMVLTGLWPHLSGQDQDALVRMTYTIQPDGSVRQFGEQSTDHGLSWSTSFDFIYKPRKTGEN